MRLEMRFQNDSTPPHCSHGISYINYFPGVTLKALIFDSPVDYVGIFVSLRCYLRTAPAFEILQESTRMFMILWPDDAKHLLQPVGAASKTSSDLWAFRKCIYCY
ncbi:hypothetical protein AVEN_248659-1 [Araneus ventricosus]|uniref:Uncharacterized protein n=1 Tax=Araneus ventricosus TaxID=182803 RepID=A0A4Y2BZS2_ARAVE|nr:hypothetical protein AVEN_248659-1 [Araneus ventricosus]